jgi:DNA-binding GntR family transcriptional regulator
MLGKPFEEVVSQNANSAAADLIRAAIFDGRLKPGDRLKEEELARAFGLSRTPIREAILVLNAERIVETRPNRGAFVRTYDLDELDDTYKLRALLEGYAAHEAALRLDESDIERLRASCQRFSTLSPSTDLQALVEENVFFHRTILHAAGSARLAEMARQVTELPLVYKSYVWYSPEQKLVSEHYHQQLTNALAAHDADRAAAIMREHVLEARDVLLKRYAEHQLRETRGRD